MEVFCSQAYLRRDASRSLNLPPKIWHDSCLPTLDAVPFVMLFCSHITTGLLAQWQSRALLMPRFRVRLPGSPLLRNSHSIRKGCYVDSYQLSISPSLFYSLQNGII